MKAAGLTHGGFYGHFSSKEDLMAQACARVIQRSNELWSKRVEAAPHDPLSSIARGYLSTRHRDDPGTGCVVAALGSEAARHGPGVRRAVTDGLRSSFELLTRLVPGKSAEARRRYASWVGAMILARAVDDRALSKEILDAVASPSKTGAVTTRLGIEDGTK
jgi:TetR/AcrR family transcriptional repressor of nem operon